VERRVESRERNGGGRRAAGAAGGCDAGRSLAAGACLGIPALTAYHAVMVDGGVSGKTVLVAGAGAVGHYAVQMPAGRAIIASVSSAQKAALAQAAGAQLVVNYRTEELVQRCLEATAGVGLDRIIEVDLAANVNADLAAVRADGDIVAYGSSAAEIAVPFVPAITRNVRLRFFIVYNLNAEDRMRAVRDLSHYLDTNSLVHLIGARLPLSRIAEAHELVEHGRVTGNVVLEI
jgi:NADPH2:quinone reductase